MVWCGCERQRQVVFIRSSAIQIDYFRSSLWAGLAVFQKKRIEYLIDAHSTADFFKLALHCLNTFDKQKELLAHAIGLYAKLRTSEHAFSPWASGWYAFYGNGVSTSGGSKAWDGHRCHPAAIMYSSVCTVAKAEVERVCHRISIEYKAQKRQYLDALLSEVRSPLSNHSTLVCYTHYLLLSSFQCGVHW